MELSKRLQAVADLLDSDLRTADIGTDHGYIPIFLIETGKCEKVIAMDINEGPLLRAKEHISEHGLTEKIETRLSDGVSALKVKECDAVIAAGMGGALVVKILEDGKEIFEHLKEFILQPQSELFKVREYLQEHAYHILEEDMVLEDGKFYPMMKVVRGQESPYDTIELRYGRKLLEQRNPVLRLFLEKEIRTKEKILKNLQKETGTHIEIRREELRRELSDAQRALRVYR